MPAAVALESAWHCTQCGGYVLHFKNVKKTWADPDRFWPGFEKTVERNSGRCHFCSANVMMGQAACPSCGYHFPIVNPRFGEPMLPNTLGRVQLDYCPRTGDIWLDGDELVELSALNNWQVWDGTGTPPPEVAHLVKRYGFMSSVEGVINAILAPIQGLFR